MKNRLEKMERAKLFELSVLVLPAYSPDLNPIEHFWATLKTRLRKDLPTAANPFLFIADVCLCYC